MLGFAPVDDTENFEDYDDNRECKYEDDVFMAVTCGLLEWSLMNVPLSTVKTTARLAEAVLTIGQCGSWTGS